MSIRPNFPNDGGFVLSYPWLALGVALGPPVWRGGFVLSYRWLASVVAFKRPDWKAVSPYHIVRSRQMFLLEVPLGGGFVVSFPRFALEALEFVNLGLFAKSEGWGASKKMKFGTLREK